MSKKKKRSRPNIPEVTLKRYAPGSAGRTTRTGGDEDFDPDYSHIVKDLKRIALLGSTFVVLLIALSFILN
ncbi:MAG: hypothetical protein ACLFWD_04980 [Anaerolineales bacterium]